ncbi:hypothetical protein EG329_004161 [Mollisiaceae sp. DMI_Dod_QoI]|nr:hypothetical protein EG329_004161 [Helotiales sp. DMI_Dod_QoI]
MSDANKRPRPDSDTEQRPAKGENSEAVQQSNCKCYGAHPDNEACDVKSAGRYQKHQDMVGKVICTSLTKTVVVTDGSDREEFVLHEDLLYLFSNYFFEDSSSTHSSKKLVFKANPWLFADFLSWIYTRDFLQGSKEIDHRPMKLWLLGDALQAPNFQNACFEHICLQCAKHEMGWPVPKIVRFIYKSTSKGCLIRKFASDSVSCKRNAKTKKERAEWGKRWAKIFEKENELSTAVVLDNRSWNGNYAWHYDFRKDYQVKEIDLDQRWKDIILKKDSMEQLGKCPNWASTVRLAHLTCMEKEVDASRQVKAEGSDSVLASNSFNFDSPVEDIRRI